MSKRKLTPTLAELDIVYSCEWSLWRPFTFFLNFGFNYMRKNEIKNNDENNTVDFAIKFPTKLISPHIVIRKITRQRAS